MLADRLEELFGTRDLFAVLGTHKGASKKELRKAYHKTALRTHPDRAWAHAEQSKEGEDESARKAQATARFQAVAVVWEIVQDAAKVRDYEESGDVPESLGIDKDEDLGWAEYWRNIHGRVSTTAIEEFEKAYRKSAEERQDVLAAYTANKGDMDAVFDAVLCCDVLRDEQRFYEMVRGAVDSGEVEAFRAFTQETKAKRAARRRRAEAEAKEAEEAKQELQAQRDGRDEGASLELMIQQRSKARADNFLAQLEAKYAANDSPNNSKRAAPKGKGKGKRKRGTDAQGPLDGGENEDSNAHGDVEMGEGEPTEQEFEAARKRLEQARQGVAKPKARQQARGKARATRGDRA